MAKIRSLIVLLSLIYVSCNTSNKQVENNVDTTQNNLSENTTKDSFKADVSFSKSYENTSSTVGTETKITENELKDEQTVYFTRSFSKVSFHPKDFVTEKTLEKVNEPIKVEYTDLRSFSSISHHGISMQYDSGATSYQLQSAAMFKIKFSTKSKNELVKTADNKFVTVELDADSKLDEYAFFKYDTRKKSWIKIKKRFKVINDNTINKSVQVAAPSKPTKSDFVFDFDINTNDFAELKAYQNIVWQYAPSKKYLNPANEKWIFDEDWQDVTLKEYDKTQHLYLIHLKNKKKEFTTLVKRALVGQDFEKAQKQYLQTQKSSTKLKVQVSISESGIYNIDRVVSFKKPFTLETDFEYLEKPLQTGAILYLLYDNQKRAVMYNENGYYNYHKLSVDLSFSDNCIVAILQDGTMLGIDNKEFMTVINRKPKAHKFKMKNLNTKAQNLEGIKTALELLQ